MEHWDSGFDRTRFCRSDDHTYKTPTCCNFVQDASIRDEIAKFLPAECLASEHFAKEGLGYTDLLKEIFCVPCASQKKGGEIPKYLKVDSAQQVTLTVCNSVAQQLWLL